MSDRKESFVPNPVLAGLVGICPLIVVSRSLAEASIYGLIVALCALILGAVVPPLRTVVPDRLQAPVTLALSAALAIAFGFCASVYSPTVAAGLGIYLPLLAVSGLSLTTLRRSSSTSDRLGPDGRSRFGAVALESLMFFLTAAVIGAVREAIGLGTITLPVPALVPARLSISDAELARFFITPAGGFIILGMAVAGYRMLKRISGRKLP
jgi:Na+-translocating ferredoxin:NAD+ oxidoreductase subunit E